MKAFSQLLLANLREFARDRMALFWTLAFPVMFILIFGLIYGSPSAFRSNLGLVIEDQGAASQQLKQRFADTQVFEISIGDRDAELAALHSGERDAVLIIPSGVSAAIAQGKTAPVELYYDPARNSNQIVLPVVAQTMAGLANELRPQPEVFALEQIAIQARQLRPMDYLIPGILAMSILNLALFATAQPIISLRSQGILRRLGATPLPRTTLLSAYISLRLLIALVQMGIIVAVGVAFFGLALTGGWLALIGVLLLGTLAFIAIAFVIAAIARTEESGAALTSAVQLPMLFLAGIFFPIKALPAFLQPVSALLPLTYLADSLRQVMVGATPDNSMLVNIAVLLAWLLGCGLVAVRFFKWE